MVQTSNSLNAQLPFAIVANFQRKVCNYSFLWPLTIPPGFSSAVSSKSRVWLSTEADNSRYERFPVAELLVSVCEIQE
jgi:hypothetical protein